MLFRPLTSRLAMQEILELGCSTFVTDAYTITLKVSHAAILLTSMCDCAHFVHDGASTAVHVRSESIHEART